MKGFRFDSGHLGPEVFILDKEVSASEYFEWDIFVLGWEGVSPLLCIEIKLYISLSPTSCYIWQIDTHIKVTCPGQWSKWMTSSDLSENSENNSYSYKELYRLQSTLTCTHFYLGYTELILPSSFYTPKETEAMKCKWSSQDYLANEERPNSNPDLSTLCSELFLWFSWTILYSAPTAKILFRLSMKLIFLLSFMFQNQKPEKENSGLFIF